MDEQTRAIRPQTIGELRRRLEDLGHPWTVPARFGDQDPLPVAPGRAEPVSPGHIEGLRAVNTAEEFAALLGEAAPTNPFLAARWQELGVTPVGPAAAVVAPDAGDVPEWGVA